MQDAGLRSRRADDGRPVDRPDVGGADGAGLPDHTLAGQLERGPAVTVEPGGGGYAAGTAAVSREVARTAERPHVSWARDALSLTRTDHGRLTGVRQATEGPPAAIKPEELPVQAEHPDVPGRTRAYRPEGVIYLVEAAGASWRAASTRCHAFPVQCSITPPFLLTGKEDRPMAQASLALSASIEPITVDGSVLTDRDTRQPVLAEADRTWASAAWAGGSVAAAASVPAMVTASMVATARARTGATATARADRVPELVRDAAIPRLASTE